MSNIISKLNDGGPFFSYPMVVFLIIIIALFLKEVIKKDNSAKTISLISSLGWFTVAWAFMGHTIGLITAFDSIEAAGNISPHILAGGLKIALLNLMFGSFILFMARLSIIILHLLNKEK